jgi:hypothetical protein
MKNKKGFALLTIFILIAVGLIAVGILSGGLIGGKISNIFSSLPAWAWLGIILLLIFLITKKKR